MRKFITTFTAVIKESGNVIVQYKLRTSNQQDAGSTAMVQADAGRRV